MFVSLNYSCGKLGVGFFVTEGWKQWTPKTCRGAVVKRHSIGSSLWLNWMRWLCLVYFTVISGGTVNDNHKLNFNNKLLNYEPKDRVIKPIEVLFVCLLCMIYSSY